MSIWGRRLACSAFVVLTGCAHVASFEASGQSATQTSDLARFLGWIALALVVVVLVALTAALLARRPANDDDGSGTSGGRSIVIVGTVLAIVGVSVLVLFAIGGASGLEPPAGAAPVRVAVTAHQWWWGVDYIDQGVQSANEIVVPVGEPVQLQFTSDNVEHSWWVPELAGKFDVVPGRVTTGTIQADQPGLFTGVCSQFCGIEHAEMGIQVLAMPSDEWNAWMQAELTAERSTGNDAQGLALFATAGCANCHTIQGTDADGTVGPDLTHVGSRRTLGAGVIRNDVGGMARWIEDPSSLKPGVKMPGYAQMLQPSQVGELVRYLEGLK